MTNPAKEGLFETHANAGLYTSDESGKAATRTVYMDSNIALTDGSAPVGFGNAKTIPNLYEAINTINSRITDHDHDGTYLKQTEAVFTSDTGAIKDATSIGNAVDILNTAVGTLNTDVGTINEINVIDYNDEPKNVVGAINKLNENINAIKDKEISNVEAYMYATVDNAGTCVLSPGANGEPGTKHADAPDAENKLRLKANDIEFEIPAPTLKGYKITAGGSAVDANTGNSVTISEGNYWIPIETTSATVSESVSNGSCGKVVNNAETGADRIISNHCRLTATITIDTTNTKNFAADGTESTAETAATIVYNLGAIIEAIQELNRRTMFMDTNMSFSGAIHYGDVTTDVNGAEHETIPDGLPGASDTNLHKHTETDA